MHRVPLDQLVLQVMSMGLGETWSFLAESLDPPPKAAVEQALSTLHAVGAIQGLEQALSTLHAVGAIQGVR
ncbi:hypothetical protein T484DRAFT_1786767 [Baffinella frigidus]|nr:hypothetical protein T484DRAFT_1786767 [Cryptophyta sp. CCMP2293]